MAQYLVCGEDDFALLLIGASDEEHVADARGVVHDDLVLVSGQHIPEHGEDTVNSSSQASK